MTMMHKAFIGLLVILSAVCAINAHSWVACADYGTETGEYYDNTLCRAFPRSWGNVAANFGVDMGYNYQATETKACRDPRTNPASAAYSAQYPMAKFAAGQRVCLAWPSKNHVAAPCTNPFIPDTDLKIFISGLNPTVDPTISEFEQHLVADLTDHVNGVIDFKGFQHCPKFCENMDKSFCSRCFNMPTNLAPGQYTMLWYWTFNPGSAPYTTCMDIEITSGTAVNATVTTAAATTAATTAAATTAAATTASATTASATTAATTAAATTASATTGTAQTTTGGSTTGTATGSALTVFDETLNSAWTTSWSWQATVTYTTSTYYTGATSMKVVLQPWGGLQLGAFTTGVAWAGKYTTLNFAIKSETASTQMKVYFNGGAQVSAQSLTGWTAYHLSLASDMQAPATLGNPNGLVFFNNGPNPVTYYIDAISFS